MGLVCRSEDGKNGLKDILKGYFALILGGIVAAAIIKARGHELIPGTSSYWSSGVPVDYWTTITVTSLMVSAIAAIAGAIVALTNRSVLTAGVMIALALVPAGSIIGMGLVEGDLSIIAKALARLGMELALVSIFGGVVFLWKKTKHI